jgi:hypothetical protein
MLTLDKNINIGWKCVNVGQKCVNMEKFRNTIN